MNERILFNSGWEYAKTDLTVTCSKGLEFASVDLPHDWLIYDTNNLYEHSIGWYRKSFTYSKVENEQVILCFDGVYMDSTLYVNEQLIGEWKYGYSAFEFDITDALVDGENEILLNVVHQSPNSRWYTGAGIYRNVWLKKRSCNHILTDGIYVTTKQDGQSWLIEVDTEVKLIDDVKLCHTLYYQDQIIAMNSEFLLGVYGKAGVTNKQKMIVTDPLLWSSETPNLYELRTELKQDAEVIESISQNIGFRDLVFDPNQGLLVNGVKTKLNGVCEHHDLGALGSAFNKVALKRRFEILKDMGVNAIRTAHNMPAKELMDLADEMGIYIVSEAFDMWEKPKTQYDYGRFFSEWVEKDVSSWVRRDRNHPSLIMWSIGNEVYDTHASERGSSIVVMLRDLVLQHDYKENADITFGSNYMPWENTQKAADILKIAGYNYSEKHYDKHHQQYPDWVIYGSETSSIVQSRGVYHFPFEKSILSDDDEQCSALGNSITSYGAKSPESIIIHERDTKYSMGQFLWTGFDYIGEPNPYHTKNSYFGQVDTATFKKDSYYIYQAAWTDYKKAPMVHIFPYWDFNPGQIIDVRVCSNAPKIELKLNEKSIGTFDIDHRHGKELVGWWKIPYEPGKLEAIAYDEDGNVIATDVRNSFGDAKNICLAADKDTLISDGTDLIFMEISVTDENGNPVENANNRVAVNVTGAGRLVGLDNGNSADLDQYKGISRRLFSGKLMAIIAAKLEPGKVQVEVTSKGLASANMEFDALLPNVVEVKGLSATSENQVQPCVLGFENEIPVRKIEIISDSGQELSKSMNEVNLEAQLYPENTSYQDVEWSVVLAGGIKSSLGKLEANGLNAKISALGDGEFRVRCTSKNGSNKVQLMSELEFKATGLGKAFKDPYDFISAGLYDYSEGEVGNGVDRGVATSREGEAQVGFKDIDFGSYGSDTITIPIFALSGAPHTLEIWEGMPTEENSEMLAKVEYQKPTKWNQYQPETYRLPKRLTGITSICFVTQQKMHIKGFSFTRPNIVSEQINAADCDIISGDKFKIKGDLVEDIGNNVAIEFQDMDFSSDGVTKLEINGCSPIDKNTIHLKFDNGETETTQIVEFVNSDDYEVQEFNLEKVAGKQKLTFLFLPGSDFDFGWFRFKK